MYMMIAAVTHLSLLLLSCCWLQKEEETGVHSSAFHKHYFQLLKYFWVGFPYLFHTYFSFFPHWISERLHLHLLPHLSLIPSYYHIWWSSYWKCCEIFGKYGNESFRMQTIIFTDKKIELGNGLIKAQLNSKLSLLLIYTY